jgi:hypothetical protein
MLAYLGEPPAKRTSVLDDSCYNATWPNVYNCRKWWTNETHRFVEGNSIPDHNEHGDNGRVIGPYCPFGENDPRGYCLPAEGKCVFEGMVCPNQTLASKLNLSGDVPVTNQIYREFTLNPDPTADDLPKHLYHGATEYQQIGVHLNGVHIKGPSEAEGYNVDTSWIPLLCGGHVTPPVGPGPVYHYHKASTCDHIETPGEHGPLLGYANDGFGIYGFQDISGTAPVVDECNGHFGPVTNADLETVFYHYHAHELTVMPSLTFTKQEPLFQPYFIGCQGPSKGKCNSTIAKAPKMMTDLYHNWCGVGCGAELCVQPGTSNSSLTTYLTKFDKGMDWIRNYTTNDYTICPECYRQNANRTTEKLPAPASREQIKRSARQLCKICDTGVCSHCQGCRDSKKGHCAGCHSGGCLPACDNCWEDILV